jgi:hypothetical protein
LRHLLPIIRSSSNLPIASSSKLSKLSIAEKLTAKVKSNLDFYLPFRQHAPSLKNARREIYADLHLSDCKDGVAFFNILAFRGVFFGSPFSKSEHFQWFESYEEWEEFRANHKNEALKVSGVEEDYYVKKNCYGRSQKERSLDRLEEFWMTRGSWNDMFAKSTPPTIEEVHNWLANSKEESTSKFYNIGSLTALLICGDLIEAHILPMPSSHELGQVIYKLGMGGKKGMKELSLVSEEDNVDVFCKAFASLDTYVETTLGAEEKEAMGYNVVMLEHTLCKIKRLKAQKTFNNIFTKI